MALYGCRNKPCPTPASTYKAQSGCRVWQNTRKPVYVDVKHAMGADCQYTRDHVGDPECSGCVHRAEEVTA